MIEIFKMNIIGFLLDDLSAINFFLEVLPLFYISMIINTFFSIIGCILKVLNKQSLVFYIYTLFTYVIQLPLIYYFSIVEDYKLKTIWTIVCLCQLSYLICLIFLNFKLDWNYQMIEATKFLMEDDLSEN